MKCVICFAHGSLYNPMDTKFYCSKHVPSYAGVYPEEHYMYRLAVKIAQAQ